MTDKRKAALKRKLQEALYRLLTAQTELAAPLTELTFVATTAVRCTSVSAAAIYFNPGWLEKLSPYSLDYALCHQLMHLQLSHLQRPSLYQGERFHYACNIIVNSHLIRYGFTESSLPGIGPLEHTTPFPRAEGADLTPVEAFRMTPFDPARLSDAERRRLLFDSDAFWSRTDDPADAGEVLLRPGEPFPDDLLPGKAVIGLVKRVLAAHKELNIPLWGETFDEKPAADLPDDALEYETGPQNAMKDLLKDIRALRAYDERDYGDSALRERVLRPQRVAAKDWRALLNHFLLDETRDYDFTPPDRRMTESGFFLPDFNASHSPRLRVLFLLDVSASLNDEDVAMAAAELQAAVDQFGGLLEATVAFFDDRVRKTFPLSAAGDLLSRIPAQAGGTDFHCIFSYIRENYSDALPSEVVIMTDGKGEIPDYAETMDIPVLWLLTDRYARIPWGRVAYFSKG